MKKIYPENFDPYSDLQHCLIEVDSHSVSIEKIIQAHNDLGDHVVILYEQLARIAESIADINERLIEINSAIK